MKRKDEPELTVDVADRRRLMTYQVTCERMVKTFEPCGAVFCNIGGGPCAECLQGRWEVLELMRSILKTDAMMGVSK